jgi:hypothetical protein
MRTLTGYVKISFIIFPAIQPVFQRTMIWEDAFPWFSIPIRQYSSAAGELMIVMVPGCVMILLSKEKYLNRYVWHASVPGN